jgi:predicted  nucleic acid-binding Zn-ribbon protein
MVVKYQCPACSKRFVEWGAQKIDFKCPDCEEEKLVLMGPSESAATAKKKPSLRKRKTAARKPKPVQAPPVDDTDSIAIVDPDGGADDSLGLETPPAQSRK